MTALPLRDFTAAEQNRLDAIEAAPAAEEALRERVARAMWAVTYNPGWSWTDDMSEETRERFRGLADAALAVLRGPSSDAEQAVERCLALADDYQASADRCREQAKRTHMIGSQHMWEQAAGDHEGRALELRAALGGA